MNSIAERYVKLVLKIGLHDEGYVDAYYGPKEWLPKDSTVSMNDSTAFTDLNAEADTLLNQLEALGNLKADEIETLRYTFLYKQLLAVKTRLFMIFGGTLDFDSETKALYDAVTPQLSGEHFDSVLTEIDKIIPGTGDLQKRFENFRNQFIIPKDKIDGVFRAAIDECRKRTLQYIDLPADENFELEYVVNKPWAAYNWYKGNSFSLIQINTELPVYIDRAVDLAAHEGYPGHHVYNALLEKELMRKRGWVEYSVYPLYSPQSLIAEGTANHGIGIVFPGESRINFEREVLFPIAGLDTSLTDDYYKVLELMSNLSFAGNEAARNYLDGKWTREASLNWLMKYLLMTGERAEQRMKFVDHYRGYVINYNLGEQIVENYVKKSMAGSNEEELRWKIFTKLLSTPQTPSGLMR
ncbi:MAG: hypothetical protein IPM56_16950 [Ignavibacteriales bacterium]|nr:MAG: hypothetical protein IPM56_16950 [Ignavibacteriales bacterium]